MDLEEPGSLDQGPNCQHCGIEPLGMTHVENGPPGLIHHAPRGFQVFGDGFLHQDVDSPLQERKGDFGMQ